MAFFLKNDQFSIPQKAQKSRKTQFCPKNTLFDRMKAGEVEIAHKRWNKMNTEPSKLTCQFKNPLNPIVFSKQRKSDP